MNEKRSLKHWRLLNDLTQKELAEKVGISVMTISSYESEKRKLRAAKYETIHRIAKELKIEIENIDFF